VRHRVGTHLRRVTLGPGVRLQDSRHGTCHSHGGSFTVRRETGVEIHSSPWERRCQRSSIRRVKDPLTGLPGFPCPLRPSDPFPLRDREVVVPACPESLSTSRPEPHRTHTNMTTNPATLTTGPVIFEANGTATPMTSRVRPTSTPPTRTAGCALRRRDLLRDDLRWVRDSL